MTASRVDPKVGDPNDKTQGQDQFASYRTGYGSVDEKLQRILSAARRGYSLQAGEGAALVAYFEAALEYERNRTVVGDGSQLGTNREIPPG